MKRIIAINCCLLVAILFGGCGKTLDNKEIMLVADGKLLLENEEGLEFSHLKVLVLNGNEVMDVIPKIINHREISYQSKVVFCDENVREKVSKDKSEITEQLKDVGTGESLTLLEFLNNIYSEKKEFLVPKIKVEKSKIKLDGKMLYKPPEKWQSFP